MTVPRRVGRPTSVCALFPVLVLGGCAPPGEVEVTPSHAVTSVDTLVSSESAAIAYAIDLDVADSGVLFVADFMGNAVLAVDSSGAVSTYGRLGEGPGEFSGPFALRAVGADLLVLDRGNGRLQRLTQDGVFQSMSPVAPQAVRAPPHLLPDGGMLVATGGADTALVAEFTPDAVRKRTVGAPVVTVASATRFGPILEMIRDGEMPGQLRNEAIAAGNASGDVWVALTAEGEIRRYGPDGALVWATAVEEPEMLASRERFFTRNVEEATPGSFYPLRYFRDLEPVGDELWVLLDTQPAGAGVILVLGSDGRPSRRIEVVGAGGAIAMAVGPAQRSVFLFIEHDAQILRARIR